jgi:hypothetical protein
VNQKNQIYFMHHSTKQTSWQDPRFLPTGWSQMCSSAGEVVYEYRETEGAAVIYRTPVDPRALPDGWQLIVVANNHMMISDDNKHVFLEAKTQLRTNVDPRGLPEGVTQHIDKNTHRLYFKDHLKRITQWEDQRIKLTPQQRVQLLRTQRTKWETAMIKSTPEEQAEMMGGGGASSSSSSSSSSSATSLTSSRKQAAAAPLTVAAGAGQEAVATALRLEGYTQFLLALLCSETLSEDQNKALARIRRERQVSNEEHLVILEMLHKKPEDLDEMTQAGQRLQESLNHLQQQQEGCVCCMDAVADHVILDCMHICLCVTCAPLFGGKDKVCPQCRAVVKEVRKTFKCD